MVVTFVGGTGYPTFEEVRPQLEHEAADVGRRTRPTSAIDCTSAPTST